MTMRAGRLLLLLFAVVGAGCDSGSGDREGTPRDRAPRAPGVEQVVRATGRGQLQGLLRRVPPGLLAGHGFSDRAELSRATVGPLYQMHALDPGRLATASRSRAPFVPMDVWRVAVLVGGEHRSLATVARVSGRLQAMEIGGAGLARELGALVSGEAGAPPSRAILRVHALRCDFLVRSPVGEQRRWRAIPLRSARRFLGLEGSTLSFPDLLRVLTRGLEDAGRSSP